jgi:hypothetical protein
MPELAIPPNNLYRFLPDIFRNIDRPDTTGPYDNLGVRLLIITSVLFVNLTFHVIVGLDAINWTRAMGDPITGGTAYWMDDGTDTGPIEVQDWCFIRPDDTPQSLWKRDLGPMGVRS